MEIKTDNQPAFFVYSMTRVSGKFRFHRIGAAWTNDRGGLNLKLNAQPIGDALYLYPPPLKLAEEA